MLSRDDYLSYDAMWRPLASVVQSAMMIRHVLFMGYSLTDDNFVRLGRDVSLLLAPVGVDRLVGTVLTLDEEPMLQEMWQDLQLLPMRPQSGEQLDAVRLLDIFLDCLGMHTASHERSYYLDPRYETLMEASDEPIIRSLRELAGKVTRQHHGHWRDITKLLERYGYR